MCEYKNIKMRTICGSHSLIGVDGTWPKFSINRLIRLNDVTGWQLCTSIAPPFLWQLASVVADVISVCVKLLMAAGKWQNSGRTPAAVVFGVVADIMPL
jgi:hypothetical protein